MRTIQNIFYDMLALRWAIVALWATCLKNLSGIPPECQTVWIQIRQSNFLRSVLGQNCLQSLVISWQHWQTEFKVEKYLWHPPRPSHSITKTCPCNILEYFTAVKWLFSGEKITLKKYEIFLLICAQNIDHGYTEAVLKSTHNLCFRAKIRKKCIPL